MKKQLILAMFALTAVGAFAQKNVVEEVEHAIGGYNSDFKAASDKIEAALTNPETKDQAKTWFIAGKANFGLYDNLMAKKQLAQQVDTIQMAYAALKGYNYFMKALPLDTIVQLDKNGQPKVDKKGNKKVKTKYSKDIVNSLIGHHNDFRFAGSFLYDAKKYADAAKCWGVYASLPFSGIAPRDKFAAPDSMIAEMEFYQGVALWQSEDLKGAVNAFANARKHGYTKKEAYDYAMSCYAGLKDDAGVIAIAQEALPLFGDKDNQYIRLIINDDINKGKYEEAKKLLDDAIAQNPNSAELYNSRGVMYEQMKDDANAEASYRKAVAIDPENPQAQFNTGRTIMKKAVAVQKKMETLKGKAYADAKEKELIPLYNEALPYMEKAYQLDPTNSSTKNILSNIYYQLGDEAKLNALDGK